MNNRFALPIALAVAVHASLMFGFRHSPVEPAAPAAPRLTDVIELVPIQDPPEISDAAPQPIGSPETDLARQPERVELSSDGPAILIPAMPSRESMSSRPVFDAGPIGVPDGDPNVTNLSGILTIAGLDNPPGARMQASPDYPFAAKRDGLDGDVVVEFLVDETGRVSNPSIVRSSNSVFDEPSLRAVLKWRFEPGRRNGRIVRFRMAVPLVFRLRED